MARVPSLDNFSVMPSTERMPQVSAPAIEPTGARQLQQFGSALERGGAVLNQITIRRQEEANQLRVIDALNKAKERAARLTFDKDEGYTQQRGIAALERESGKTLTDDYSETFAKTLDELQAGLGNDAQRQAFRERGRELMAGFRTDIVRHEAKEFDTYATSVDEGAIANAQDDMGRYWNDPARLNEASLTIRASSDRLRNRLGKSAEWGEARTRELLSAGHTRALAAAVEEDDLSFAEKYLDRYKEEMTSDDVLKVDALIGKQQDATIAMTVADEIFAGSAKGEPAGDYVMPVRAAAPVGGQKFGAPRSYGGHSGVDMAVPVGTPVSAPASGVARVRKTKAGGNEVWIEEPGGRLHKLLHLNGADVEDGQTVRAGQAIGRSGNTGTASHGAHVHWTVYQDGKPVNPTQSGGRKGYAGRSLLDMIQALGDDPRLAANPERRQQAEQRIRSLYQAQEEGEREAKEQTLVSVYGKLLGSKGDITVLTASDRAALGTNMPTALSFANAVERSMSPDARPDLNLWAQLKGDPDRLAKMPMSELLKLQPRLGRQAFQDIVTDRAALDKGDKNKKDSLDTLKSGLQFIDTELRAAGFDTSPKPGSNDAKEFGEFRAAYIRAIQAEESATGKSLTPERARQVGLELLTEQAQGTGWFTGTKRRYEQNALPPSYESIPPAVRQALGASLRRRLGPGTTVTRGMIREEYGFYLRNQEPETGTNGN